MVSTWHRHPSSPGSDVTDRREILRIGVSSVGWQKCRPQQKPQRLSHRANARTPLTKCIIQKHRSLNLVHTAQWPELTMRQYNVECSFQIEGASEAPM